MKWGWGAPARRARSSARSCPCSHQKPAEPTVRSTAARPFSSSEQRCPRQRPGPLLRTGLRSQLPEIDVDFQGQPPSRPIPRFWPHFRAESPEERLIRVHKLYNPSEEASPDVSRLPGPPSSSNVRTARPISQTSSSALETELIHRALKLHPSGKTINILEHLLVERGETPSEIHYEALILANSSPEHGSVTNVKTLMKEMEQRKLTFDAKLYTALLRTLVVHPDLGLLDKVIDSCEKMWIELDLEMLHFICAIYIRVGMVELAMDYFERIEACQVFLPDPRDQSIEDPSYRPGNPALWLYVLFAHHLANLEDWDSVTRILYRLNDDNTLGVPFAMRQIDVPYEFWHWLLQKAVNAGDIWVSTWIWDIWVSRAWVVPSERTCLSMLQLCVNHGRPKHAHAIVTILQHLPRPARAQTMSKAQQLLREVEKKAEPSDSNAMHITNPMVASHWWMFKPDHDLEKQLDSRIRIEPWSTLPSGEDPGRSWPRVLYEREEYQKQFKEMVARHKAFDEDVAKEKARQAALTVLPRDMLRDINSIANLEPEAGLDENFMSRLKQNHHAETREESVSSTLETQRFEPFDPVSKETSDTPLFEDVPSTPEYQQSKSCSRLDKDASPTPVLEEPDLAPFNATKDDASITPGSGNSDVSSPCFDFWGKEFDREVKKGDARKTF